MCVYDFPATAWGSDEREESLMGVATWALTIGATSAPTDTPTVIIFTTKFSLMFREVTLTGKKGSIELLSVHTGGSYLNIASDEMDK